MTDRAYFCTACASPSVEIVEATVDPRYPIVYCHQCLKRGPGIDSLELAVEHINAARTRAARRAHARHQAKRQFARSCADCQAESRAARRETAKGAR